MMRYIPYLIAKQTEVLLKEITSLRDEVASLKTQLAASQCKTNHGTQLNKTSFADIVRDTMNDTLIAEKCKSQVVISNVDESGNDDDVVLSLCKKIEPASKPQSVLRMGKKEDGKTRPLRVTFESNFEARSFLSKYSNAKNNKDGPAVKVRPCRTKEEEAVYKEKLKQLRELNNKAKANGNTTSFSLRHNGAIWRFKKDPTTSKWNRDPEWTEEAPSTPSLIGTVPVRQSGNGD
jgi:hypothetical protein